ncbi:UpxY family transcription antiterminator [Bacteroides sp.]
METTNRKIEEKTSCWYAVYTAVKAEKSVKERLDEAGIESYLPLQPVVRLWNNRKRKVMIPVIPGCIFVRLSMDEVAKVKNIKGVSFLLREEGQYISIPQCQMDTFRCMVENAGDFIEFAEELTPDTTVRVIRGQLKGVMGELVNCQGKDKLMLRINGLGSALIMVTSDSVEKVK